MGQLETRKVLACANQKKEKRNFLVEKENN